MREIDYAKLDTLVLDVDGVLTDGKIVLTPGGDEIKEFHVRDGAGIKYWQRVGHRLAIISGRSSPAVMRRAEELGVAAVRLNAKDKAPALEEILRELGVTPDRVAAVGDDLPDVPVLRRVAFPVAVADAVDEVRGLAAYVTQARGGYGAVREVIELILRKSGKWQRILERYFPAPRESAS
ncbi:MAG: 3-deoxy-D-manno-octulosonate 8-phosphate phosphatase KdsC [Planctomycetes bacterium ADurb.Bin126]|nr:MAG: 3-deoxy-D-manno-octulosonate 8-phosphate phosphatase KdsC [Planctomycetes bacterium ADurb.Bin126]HOD80728.1 HAD hydrolase family protein [Phycisphaerae bacterium]HQL74928.1 HAD hydrolase family protein [Phycisphaerae bacterium]